VAYPVLETGGTMPPGEALESDPITFALPNARPTLG
jgi:hypothetical protein